MRYISNYGVRTKTSLRRYDAAESRQIFLTTKHMTSNVCSENSNGNYNTESTLNLRKDSASNIIYFLELAKTVFQYYSSLENISFKKITFQYR